MHGTIHLFDALPRVEFPVRSRPAPLVREAVREKPLVGLIRNRRSHRNKRKPCAAQERDNVIMTCPRKRGELIEILAGFAERGVDYIAIDGGDGTVRDVLTCGVAAFGDSWPTLILLPAGKTNALAHDLQVPGGWTLEQALIAARTGRVEVRRPVVVSQRDNPRAQVRGFVLGGGAFTRAIALGQKSHSLGAFDSLAVGVTGIWSLLQTLTGGRDNPWRKGTGMRLRDGAGRELPHRGGLPAGQRYMLLASTLERLPLGIDPFAGIAEPLRLGVLDNASFGLLARVPAMLRKGVSRGAMARGAHVFGARSLALDIEDSFILDGEAFPAGRYDLAAGPALRFVAP